MIQERVPKLVFQLQFLGASEQQLDLPKAILLNLGYKEDDLTATFFKKTPAIELFDEQEAKLKRVKALFTRLRLPGIQVRQRRLLPKDWLTRWKADWKPAPLTKKLDVVPVWYRDKYKARRGRDYILMDTLLSFGTGLHETTRFMAQFIEDQKGAFRSFLDIGTGTGILAFVALKCGAEEVQAIDIGPLSIEAAKANMKVNRLYFKVKEADIKTFRLAQSFDLVAANLVTEDLITHAPKILKFVKPGGLLAVSGISLDNLKKLRTNFSSLPLKYLKIAKGKQWSGLLYQKRMS
jgi:ribosomal protein L11 methyltransferase